MRSLHQWTNSVSFFFFLFIVNVKKKNECYSARVSTFEQFVNSLIIISVTAINWNHAQNLPNTLHASIFNDDHLFFKINICAR